MVLAGLLDASLFFDLHRLPELFCAFPGALVNPQPFIR